jgi:hypothetical protein
MPVQWKGDNIAEVGAFADVSDFGYVVGSNYHNYKWYHKLWNRLTWRIGPFKLEWTPPDDPTVLEIYPTPYREDEYYEWHWTTARVGDFIYRDGTVLRK